MADTVARPLESLFLGRMSFAEAREMQNERAALRSAGSIADQLLFCEHPPTVSIGKRTEEEHLLLSETEYRDRGFEVVRAERGGSVTLHLPGQLVLYPVVKLPERGLGVKSFICAVMKGMNAFLAEQGLKAEVLLEPAGIWVGSGSRKLASVGLKIERGVSNHGFSLNLDCDTSVFSSVKPCGHGDIEVSSVKNELGNSPSVELASELLYPHLSEYI